MDPQLQGVHGLHGSPAARFDLHACLCVRATYAFICLPASVPQQ